MPDEGIVVKTGGTLPKFVLIFLALQIGFGLLLAVAAILSLRRWQKRRASLFVPLSSLQIAIWGGLIIASIAFLCYGKPAVSLVLLLCIQFFPRWKEIKKAE
jgi:hypothetical protein